MSEMSGLRDVARSLNDAILARYKEKLNQLAPMENGPDVNLAVAEKAVRSRFLQSAVTAANQHIAMAFRRYY